MTRKYEKEVKEA
ncbi:MAG: DUF4355 domain-containing protein [Lactobacillus helveticus]|nr:Protein of unknown function [Lactobacillus helveticus CIRM-BIA 104]